MTKDEFQKLYHDATLSVKEIGELLGLKNRSDLAYIARKFGLETRRELGIHYCPERRCIDIRKRPTCKHYHWCKANPHAEQLPCELSPTVYVDPGERVETYRSPLTGTAVGT
jgi:hypothetical protein